MVGDDPPFKVVTRYNYNTSKTRILSYSLFGSDPRYYTYMLRNIRETPFVYPGWTVRVHVHERVPKELVKPLMDTGAQVYIIHDDALRAEPHTGNTGTFWRFLPLTDPRLDVIVLDSDDSLKKYKSMVVDPVLNGAKCFGGIWRGPFPQAHVLAGALVKVAPCTVAFTEDELRHYPVRAPFGADEYFLAMKATVDQSRTYRYFSDIWNQLAWYIARSPV